MWETIIGAIDIAMTPVGILYIILGVSIGVFVGAVPGINGPMAVALTLPISYYIPTEVAVGFLVGIGKGSFFGGSIPGVLINTPGTPESVPTTWEGYQLSKQGKAGKAMKMALYASVSGDVVATLVLILCAAPLASVAMYMGPSEMFALICFAMTLIAGVGAKSVSKGIIAGALGIFVATIGIDPVTSMPRLTFGITELERGIPLIPVAIGMLAFSEIILELERRSKTKEEIKCIMVSSSKENNSITFKEYWQNIKAIIRGSAIGVGIGALPGVGAPVAAFLGYDNAKKASKKPEEYGKGSLEGIAATESANSAVAASALIPLFVLGVPGNLIAALLIGAFMMHGILPGPLMFQQNEQMIYSIYFYLVIASGLLIIIGNIGIRVFGKCVQAPPKIIYPIVLFTCLIGSYLAQTSTFDVFLMVFFAFIAYFMKKFDFNVVCFLIGFILAPIWEISLQQVISLSMNNYTMFFTRPVAMILMILTFWVIIKTIKPKIKSI
ncbi:MAG: tripartite tricarboxylate transporter permease [Thermodesulfovibrionales bacterium]|nr:tripartite tricarboxylate transporter permease [Thermodesulfovibrionales bacterium]